MKKIEMSLSGMLHWNSKTWCWEVEDSPFNTLPEMIFQNGTYQRPSGNYGKVSITITSIEPVLDEATEE